MLSLIQEAMRLYLRKTVCVHFSEQFSQSGPIFNQIFPDKCIILLSLNFTLSNIKISQGGDESLVTLVPYPKSDPFSRNETLLCKTPNGDMAENTFGSDFCQF